MSPLGLIEALLDAKRLGGVPRPNRTAEGILDLLPAARGAAASSRRIYSEQPFDHHSPVEDPKAFERGLSPLARRLGDLLPRDGVVLEAGSGAGHMTTWLRGKGIAIVAVDQSIESLRRLRARTDAPAVAADVTALPFADSVFDAVLADGVVHHTIHPAAALRELARVLRPGGLLFIRIYRAESKYPSIHRTVGGLLRMASQAPPFDAIAWQIAFPAYRLFADRRYRRQGEEPGCHDEGVFSDYFLTPRAIPMRGSSLLGALRRIGFDILGYEPYRNVHGFLARKRGGQRTPESVVGATCGRPGTAVDVNRGGARAV